MMSTLDQFADAGRSVFGPNALQEKGFGESVARVIAIWSHIDGDLASILSRFLKADIAVGTSMYTAIANPAARNAALRAAAREALPDWHFNLFCSVLDSIQPARKLRNRFAHEVWGTDEALPDAVLLTPATTIIESNVSFRQRTVTRPDGTGVIAPRFPDHSKIDVLRAVDFERAINDAQRAQLFVMRFYFTMADRNALHFRMQLFEEPEPRAALMSKKRFIGPRLPDPRG